MGAGINHKRIETQLGDKRGSDFMSMDTHLTRRRLQWYGHVRGRGEQDATQQVLSMTVRGAGREEDYGYD